MKEMLFLVLAFAITSVAHADTPPPGSVKAKTYSGDGNTAITATGTALDVNIHGSSGATVDQGAAGTDPWAVHVTSSALPTNACQETGGNLAAILTKLNASIAITAAALPLPAGAATVARPALGTAGSASSDVITVQGITSMTPLKVDVSGSTGPINLAQVNGATVDVGNGTAGSGTQRVTIASNNSALAVNATPVVPAATTIKQAAITVGTSAIRLTTDAAAPSATRVLLVAQLIFSSTANCYFGSSSVTSSSTARGVQMLPGQTFSWSNDAGDYYAICDTSAQTFLVTEQE